MFGGAAKEVGDVRTKNGLPMKMRFFYDQLGGAPVAGKEYPQYPSPENLGWVDVSDGARGVTAGIAKFWQTWPKGVEVRGGDAAIRLHVWSNVEQKVHKVPEGYDQKWETLCSETVPGRANFYPAPVR